MVSIFIQPENTQLFKQAHAIAAILQGAVIVTDKVPPGTDSIVVFVNAQGIAIGKADIGFGEPVSIDFAAKKMQYRQKNSTTRKEALARATGMKTGQPINIADATAGLGGDSFILANLGANMLMLERSPLVHLLLQDAIKRAETDARLKHIMARMELIKADAITYFDNIKTRPDVIYMDPMFPDKTKAALSKKEMRLFREIAGADEDIDLLLEKSLQTAKKRVVIKRPRKSPYVNNIRPDFEISGKSSRFDVYIINRLEMRPELVLAS